MPFPTAANDRCRHIRFRCRLAGRGLGQNVLDRSERLLDDLQVQIIDLDRTQSALAVEAYKRFGRRSGHPAKLNFGDCFFYALAKALDLPLLFKDDEFVHTDIRSASAAA